MDRINSADISFRSTIIPRATKKPFMAYFEALKNCNLLSMPKTSVEEAYKDLFVKAKTGEYHSGVMLDRNSDFAMRFLGYNKENDEYIFNQLQKTDKNVQYVRDIPDDGLEHGRIELFV